MRIPLAQTWSSLFFPGLEAAVKQARNEAFVLRIEVLVDYNHPICGASTPYSTLHIQSENTKSWPLKMRTAARGCPLEIICKDVVS